MDRLKEFLLNNFLKSLLTLLIPFFAIISLTYIIKLSNLSAKISLDFIDFVTLYFYLLPHIIFATIPLTFIGAIINSLSKLSNDNEMIAIFSVGYSALDIIKIFIPISLLISIFLTILTIYIVPYADQSADNYKAKKIYESKVKVLPKKLSQSFGKSHIFIEKNVNGEFKNVIMFTKENNGYYQIMVSDNGYINKENNITTYISLNDGTLYRYKEDKFQIVNFKNMKLFNNDKVYASKIVSPINFWKNKKGKFYYFLLISISPIVILPLLISLGIYNPRYETNKAYTFILLTSLFVYIPAMLSKDKANLYFTLLIITIWIAISVLIFRKKLYSRY